MDRKEKEQVISEAIQRLVKNKGLDLKINRMKYNILVSKFRKEKSMSISIYVHRDIHALRELILHSK